MGWVGGVVISVTLARTMPLELIHTFETEPDVLPLIGDFISLGNRLLRVDGRTWPISVGAPVAVTLHCTEVNVS